MGTCSSVRQWQPGQRRSGLRGAVRQGALLGTHPRGALGLRGWAWTWGPYLGAVWGWLFAQDPLGQGRPEGAGGAAGRAPAHLTRLCSVATGSGLSWDSGVAARPGESPASMGNLRP